MALTVPTPASAAAERARVRANARAIAARVSGPDADLRAYRRAYAQQARGVPEPCSTATLTRAIAAARVLYVGDYHTLPAAQQAFCRLLQRLPRGRPVVLALEFVPGRKQRACDALLRGDIAAPALLAAIGGAHGDATGSWAGMRQVFALARRRRWPVVGLDSRGGRDGTLARRDSYAAARIAAVLDAAPQALVAVLAGELHVAPTHLPAAVARACRSADVPPPRRCIVYQNSHTVLFALAQRYPRRRVGCARLAPDTFCLLHTAPSACQQSFLDWTEADARARCDDG